jgi:predicted permease
MRYALRQLGKSPGFTAVTVLTLALGIGANTAIFTLLDRVLVRPLPVRNPEELCVIAGQHSYPRFVQLRERNDVFLKMVATHALLQTEFRLSDRTTGQAKAELVSGSYFEMMGLDAQVGRVLQAQDDLTREGSPVAVVSHAFWRRILGGTNVIGQVIHVRSAAGNASTSGLNIYDGATDQPPEGVALTIVGVAPPGFFGDTVGLSTDLWIPMMMQPAVMPGRPWLDKKNVSFTTVLGRLKPGLSRERAEAGLAVLWRQILTDEAGADLSKERERAIAGEVLKLDRGEKGFDHFRGSLSQLFGILMGVVALVLFIACLNVANLLLARGSARQHEFGVRAALGATRPRLVRQLLTECALLSVGGGLLGLLVACAGVRVLGAMASGGYQPLDLPRQPDLRALAFTGMVALLTTFSFGLGPALRATRGPMAAALQRGSRHSPDRAGRRAARCLVGVQVSVSVVLLIGAGLLLRTLHNLRSQDVGYEAEHLVMMSLDPVSAGYHGDDIGRVCQQILERLRGLPGVRGATYSENGLFHGPESGTQIDVDGFTPGSVDDRRVRFDQIGPGYFSQVGIPLLLGREIDERDKATGPRVAVINESLAKFYFPSRNPIGQRLRTGIGRDRFDLEIVGVARDARDHSFWWKPLRRFYVPYLQPIDGITAANFAVRTVSRGATLEALLRREVQAVNPRLTVMRVRHLQGLMDQSLAQTRLITRLSSFFAVLATVLAAVGLYGVLAYEVAQRRRELGIRLALGAQRRDVLRLVVRQGMKVVLAGVTFGLLASLGLSRGLTAWLFEIQPTDPATLIVTPLLMTLVALLACWWPARQASRVEPMKALRCD